MVVDLVNAERETRNAERRKRRGNSDADRRSQARYRERNRATLAAKALARYYRLRDVMIVQKQASRAAAAGVENTLTPEQWAWVLERYGRQCAYCGAEANGRPLEMDHAVPLSGGGANALGNVVPACHDCNHTKSAQPLTAWMNRDHQPLFDPRHRCDARGEFYAQLLGQPEAWAEYQQSRWGELGPPLNMDEVAA